MKNSNRLFSGVKKSYCYLFGHDWNEIALEHYYFDCERCGHEESIGEPYPGNGVIPDCYYRLRNKVRDIWFRLTLKFGKHDDDVPF